MLDAGSGSAVVTSCSVYVLQVVFCWTLGDPLHTHAHGYTAAVSVGRKERVVGGRCGTRALSLGDVQKLLLWVVARPEVEGTRPLGQEQMQNSGTRFGREGMT